MTPADPLPSSHRPEARGRVSAGTVPTRPSADGSDSTLIPSDRFRRPAPSRTAVPPATLLGRGCAPNVHQEAFFGVVSP